MKKILIGTTFIFCTSCGIKGPPLPPIDEDVARKQKAESVTVSTITSAAAASSSDATSATPAHNKNKKK